MNIPKVYGRFLVWISCALLFVSFWQLEMVYVGISTGWGYNFAGFGDFGWQLWSWRDFWYLLIFASFVLQAYAIYRYKA